jgi:tetratricopeptide (TPR) repeat protein
MSVLLFAFALVSTASCFGQSGSATPAVDYSAEPIVVEKLETVYRFSADGTGTREMTTVARIQSDAAARQYGVLNFPFASNSEHVEFDYIRVRKADGSIVETPASDAQEMPLEVTRQAPFYSDLKEKQVPVRNLRMGDKLEYKVRIIGTKAEAPGQFWGQDTFGLWAVILNESIELHVPKTKYVKVWSPTVQPAKTESGDETIYRWTGSQLEPLAGKDSKLKHREIDPKGELPTIAWTTFKSWEDVGAWYRGLEADRATPDATIKAKVAEVTAGKTTEEEKAHALYSYVATQIRYIGVAFGVGRYQPHPAAEVLRNQYGDCKDKHTLLAAMLTAAGLNPSASLIGAGIRLNPDVPSPSAFNHMITMVPMGGKEVWLDTTAEVAPWGLLLATTRDKETLVVPDTGAAKLEKTPQALPFTPLSIFTARGTLNKEGTMKAQIEYKARGDDEVVLRTLLRQVSPGQWDDLSQRLSQAMGFSGTTSHTEAVRPDKTDEPARISYDYEREKTGDWENHRIIALFPVIYLGNVDDKYPPKKQPIQLGEPHVETSTSVIKLPAGWGAELPAAVHQKTAWITLDKTYKIEGDTLTSERRMEVLQREVPASEWKAYKKWYDTALGDGEPYITLISTETKTDAEIKEAAGGDKKAEAAALLGEAIKQMQRGEVIAAEKTLDHVRGLNEKQSGLWAAYAYLNTLKMKWVEAADDYKKELANGANGQQQKFVYLGLADAQMRGGHAEDALETLRTAAKKYSADDTTRKALRNTLVQMGHADEALPLLEDAIANDPNDRSARFALGSAQIKAGKLEAGRATLVAYLEKETEPLGLNNAAYELSNAGLDLDLAEKTSRKSIEIVANSAATFTVGEMSKDQQIAQATLVSAWDTLGWILFREGKNDEAESYLRAAWLNTQKDEVALHLGQFEEKAGHLQKAMTMYQLGLAAAGDNAPKNFGLAIPDPVRDDLHKHVDALKKKGVSLMLSDSQKELTKLRTLPLGPKPGKNLLMEYAVLIRDGKVASSSSKNDTTAGSEANRMIQKANVNGWTPLGSTTTLIRKGTLNCHSGVCEFVVYPM